MRRSSGILMHISSLPSNYGIGSLGKEAYEFIDFLKEAKIRYWQLLPLGPTSYGDSPYAGFSSFAGNHYFIDLDLLIGEGLLNKEEVDTYDFGDNADKVDYGKQFGSKKNLLTIAYERAKEKRYLEEEKYKVFKEDNAHWLEDYALYMSLKKFFEYKAWYEWPHDIKCRYDYALHYYKNLLQDEIALEIFIQYKFAMQFKQLKDYAHQSGVLLIGDLPIYVAEDSCDTWVNTHLFEYDNNRVLKQVAGCPPDVFSSEGQLWGNPVYNWNANRQENYRFWISRFESAAMLFDVIRLDHFRGFDTFWSVPAGSKNAVCGRWNNGPRMELFSAVRNKIGNVDMIAEDLGILNDSARNLLVESKFPGMKILQFAFGSGMDNPYLPHNYKDNNCVVYTGTHDNNTTKGWQNEMNENEKRVATSYMNVKADSDFVWKTIETAYTSRADLAIIQVQDFLEQDEYSRMNMPASLSSMNWSYRVSKGKLTKDLANRIKLLLEKTNRV